MTALLQDASRRCPGVGRCLVLSLFGLLVLLNVLLLVVLSVRSTSHPVSTLDAVASRHTLRIGATLDYPPFSMRCADGTAAGADVDAAFALAASLGVQLRIVPTTWATLLDDAVAGAFDAAAGGISVTLARLRRVGFSRGRYPGGKVVVAPCGSRHLSDTGDAPPDSAVVAVNPGGTNEEWVREHWPEASTLVVAQLSQYGAILAGRADLTVTDAIEGRLVASRHPGALCKGDALLTHEVKAFLLPRADDVAWTAYVDRWLKEREASGEDEATLERWLVRLGELNETEAARACDGATRAPVDT